jgi:hypothetical protein
MDILSEIQSQITTEGKELSVVQIDELLSNGYNNEMFVTLKEGLDKKLIEPNFAMIRLINNFSQENDLLTAGLIIRSGTDSNSYINKDNIGKIHILAYAYVMLENVNATIFNGLIAMLILNGSNYDKPVFRPEENSRNPLPLKIWLQDNGYFPLYANNKDELEKLLGIEFVLRLNIMLDRAQAVSNFNDYENILTIKAHANSLILDTFISPYKIPYGQIDNIFLNEALKNYNILAFRHILYQGIYPSYNMVNVILLAMRQQSRLNRPIGTDILANILVEAIDIGTPLDLEQGKILTSIGKNVYKDIDRIYSQTYWKKICKIIPGKAPRKLQLLGFNLNLRTSANNPFVVDKKSLCNDITRLASANQVSLKESAIRRQRLRMSSSLGDINDFMDINYVPIITCKNIASLPINPLEYNDICISYYKDFEGNSWCFTWDSYQDLIDSKQNQYNQAILPEYFLNEIISKAKILSGISKNQIKTVLVAIDELNSSDTINDSYSDSMLNKLFCYSQSQYGICKSMVRKWTIKQMDSWLYNIGITAFFDELNQRHGLTLFSYIVDDIPEQSRRTLFQLITM